MEIFKIINDIEAHHTEAVQTEKKKRGRPKQPPKIVQVAEEIKEKKRIGRPIVPWRHEPDGTYHSHSADPKYGIRYYHENYTKPYTCEICGTTLKSCGSSVHKHKRGMHCQLAKFKKELEAKAETEQKLVILTNEQPTDN